MPGMGAGHGYFKENEESKQHRTNLPITSFLNNDLLIALTYKGGADLHS